ncbi:MAG: rhodanese-like domain-containing protein [Gammaproteobacteria bacterium]
MQELTNFLSQHSNLTITAIIIFVLVSIVEFIRINRNRSSLSVAETTQKINREQAVVIDTRSPDAFNKGHIVDAISIPAKDLQPNNKKLEKYRTKPIIIVCATGADAQKIAATLAKAGYNTYILAGGVRAWADAAMPLVKN